MSLSSIILISLIWEQIADHNHLSNKCVCLRMSLRSPNLNSDCIQVKGTMYLS